MLTACAVEIENRQASPELAQLAQSTDSVYLGWRMFQDKCAACHGTSAIGTANGPNLLPSLRDMSPNRFVGLVLSRYDWSLAGTQNCEEEETPDALTDRILQRDDFPQHIPAWQGDPAVHAHLLDLFVYLTARAQDRQGPGRPSL